MNLKIGKFFNIPLYLNVFTIGFGLFLLGSEPISLGIYILCLFFVVLHEYGHCRAAQWQKLNVIDVTIYPFGGAANIEYKEINPTTELIVTIAGPLVNAVILLLLLPALLVAYYRD